MISRKSVTVNQQQNSELVKLDHSIESGREGQEGFANVFEEADNHNPGTGVVIREIMSFLFSKTESKHHCITTC